MAIKTINLFARACFLIVFLFQSSVIFAAIPNTISYQGFLSDDAGVPVSGNHQLVFSLYTQASAPTASWNQASNITFAGGVFHAQLGGVAAPFPANLFDTPLWLGISINGEPELSPRQALSSVAFTFRAAEADLLEGKKASALDQSSHLSDTGNPHSVTAEQLGAASTSALDAGLLGKADLLHDHNTVYYSQAAVDALVLGLQNDNAQLTARIVALETLDYAGQIQALRDQVSALQNANNAAVDLMQFVTINGNDVFFEGMNLHLNNGSGDQTTANSLGNLVVGYNPPGSGSPSKTGSHNLILGEEQAYTSTGAIISGSRNTVAAENASAIAAYNAVLTGAWGLALAGSNSEVTGTGGVALAGRNAKAYGTDSLSAGGDNGLANGKYAVRIGGSNNVTQGYASVALGGYSNNVSGPYSIIAGGYTNAINAASPNDPNGTEARNSAIIGGQNNVLNSNYALIAGGNGNNINYGDTHTRGDTTTIVGGKNNTASGNNALIAGGESNTVESSAVSGVVGRNSNIFGGTNNNASGQDGAILGGDGNSVTVQHALALGGSGQVADSTGGETLSRLQQLENTFLGVSRSGDELIFNGLNIQLLNGLGQTDLINGLGNLTIGYNELRTTGSPPDNTRTGSHNLVLGRQNNYSGWGGIIHGFNNSSTAALNAILGAQHADTSAEGASTFGGSDGDPSALFASVHGGRKARVSGDYAASLGGNQNTVSGFLATGVGGEQNTASGDASLIDGGWQNTASGSHSLVTGGRNNTAGRNYSSIHGGRNVRTNP